MFCRHAPTASLCAFACCPLENRSENVARSMPLVLKALTVRARADAGKWHMEGCTENIIAAAT